MPNYFLVLLLLALAQAQWVGQFLISVPYDYNSPSCCLPMDQSLANISTIVYVGKVYQVFNVTWNNSEQCKQLGVDGGTTTSLLNGVTYYLDFIFDALNHTSAEIFSYTDNNIYVYYGDDSCYFGGSVMTYRWSYANIGTSTYYNKTLYNSTQCCAPVDKIVTISESLFNLPGSSILELAWTWNKYCQNDSGNSVSVYIPYPETNEFSINVIRQGQLSSVDLSFTDDSTGVAWTSEQCSARLSMTTSARRFILPVVGLLIVLFIIVM